MAKSAFFRLWNLTKMSISDSFLENKKWFILSLVLVAFGLVGGLIAGIRIAPDVILERVPDSFLRRFIAGEISVLGLFFSRVLVTLGLFFIIFVTNCRPWLSCVSLIIIAYRAFCMGLTCTIVITIFKVGGVINVLLVLLPSQFLLLLGLVFFDVTCVSYNFGCRIYGGSIFCREFFTIHRVPIYFAIFLAFISILLEIMLLPWLVAFLIV